MHEVLLKFRDSDRKLLNFRASLRSFRSETAGSLEYRREKFQYFVIEVKKVSTDPDSGESYRGGSKVHPEKS